jgi:hypothetical protein
MSNVIIIHKMADCVGHVARLAKFGYSRRSCYSAGIRMKLLRPILQQIMSWYKAEPETRRIASNDLFTMHSSTLHVCIVFPVHFSKTVGLSPFVDGVIKMQKRYSLTYAHSIGLCYNVLANNSSFYFWHTCQYYLLECNVEEVEVITKSTCVDLRVLFQDKLWGFIVSNDYNHLPQRHQPCNNTKPSNSIVKALIVNLIRLSLAMCDAIVDDHNHYVYFHSKAVSILMEKVDKGGCFAAGPLTSQGLLHMMAALGLIPIKFANCGEGVKVPNFLANIEKNNHCEKYLQSLALSLNISLAEAKQVTCKFGRSLTGSEGRYQDATFMLANDCIQSYPMIY